MQKPALDPFFQKLQKSCLPGVWSKGVTLARGGCVQIDRATDDEIILRVKNPDRPVSAKVSLWPGDDDYFCDCEDRADPCFHVAASVAALRTGSVSDSSSEASTSRSRVEYRFSEEQGFLVFERWVAGKPLTGALVAYVGGIESGRIAGPQVDATRDDFAIDHALGEENVSGRLSKAVWKRLMPALRSLPAVAFEGSNLVIGAPLHRLRAVVKDDTHGGDSRAGGKAFRLVFIEDPVLSSEGARSFKNGVCLVDGQLRILEEPSLDPEWVSDPVGKRFSGQGVVRLLDSIIPELEKKLPVEIQSRGLPVLTDSPPRIELRTEVEFDAQGNEWLNVVPALIYESEHARRDQAEEHRLLRKLQSELQMVPGHRVAFRGKDAIDFVKRASEWELRGDGVANFIPESGEVSVDLSWGGEMEEGDSFLIRFRAPSGKAADPSEVLRAWSAGESHVRLIDGGYARIPAEWLSRFAHRLGRMIALKRPGEDRAAGVVVPPELQPEMIRLLDENVADLPEKLKALSQVYESHSGIPSAILPSDLVAELRPYQKLGVDWLCFHREAGTGALLADDMGLGKTLQAITSLRGKTLIVCPTSVLHSWGDQIRNFRPGLRVDVYHGVGRSLGDGADVTLTTYGLLRLDLESLSKVEWETLILDEAQTIKNPDSRVARSAHALGLACPKAFRVALSGTPVENALDDLWSQFYFLNPGLLGSRSEFSSNRGSGVTSGNGLATDELRRLVKPFILRRMKRDVAKELPPKTEVVLRAEFNPSERELYETLLASSRREILERLMPAEGGDSPGASLFGALEKLLRLRQACCHPRLLPGETAETSSKLDLFEETLRDSVEHGHRVLVFSQWTSFLDLLQARVERMGIRHCRLDGETRDRAKVVQEFQRPDGPEAMLISLKAGGVGVTLTAADHVFLMDSWWNPAIEEQASDRAHRIGQENPVFVYRFVVADSIEEKILQLQSAKKALSQSIFSEEPGNGAVGLTREDILGLVL